MTGLTIIIVEHELKQQEWLKTVVQHVSSQQRELNVSFQWTQQLIQKQIYTTDTS